MEGECVTHVSMEQWTHRPSEKFWGWPQLPQEQVPKMSIYMCLVIDFLGKKMLVIKG